MNMQRHQAENLKTVSFYFFDDVMRFRVISVEGIFTKHVPSTVEFLWLEHLWNHENMLQTGVIRASEL